MLNVHCIIFPYGSLPPKVTKTVLCDFFCLHVAYETMSRKFRSFTTLSRAIRWCNWDHVIAKLTFRKSNLHHLWWTERFWGLIGLCLLRHIIITFTFKWCFSSVWSSGQAVKTYAVVSNPNVGKKFPFCSAEYSNQRRINNLRTCRFVFDCRDVIILLTAQVIVAQIENNGFPVRVCKNRRFLSTWMQFLTR